MECLDSYERYLHSETVRALIKIALAHAQFETIHPFLDGNGRIGRLLIAVMMYNEKILKEPLLYLSLYFKENRDEYYTLLQDIREKGNGKTGYAFFCPVSLRRRNVQMLLRCQ